MSSALRGTGVVKPTMVVQMATVLLNAALAQVLIAGVGTDYVHRDLWQPRLAVLKRMINIGLPAGGEFGLMFVFMAVIYWVIRDFGAGA